MGNNIEKDTLELVLKEMLDEQKNANKINTDLVSAINQLTSKVNGFNERLERQKIVTPAADIKPVQEIIKKGILDIQIIAASQPKNVTRKFQLLLFPEQDAKLFYKIVFGRWFMWLAVMLFFTFLYKWLVYRSDNDKQVMIEVSRNNRISKAWNCLYQHSDRNLHKKMDRILINSQHQISEK
jgi:uncharacterized membrane protein